MSEVARPVICPFCGLLSEVPHPSQSACIEALRLEVERTRRMLDTTASVRRADSDRDRDLELT